MNGNLYKPKFGQHSKNSSRHKGISSNTKNYSMLKKYLITNDKIKEEAKYQIMKKKLDKKHGTPVSYSIGPGENNSIDSKHLNDISGLTNRSHLDTSQRLQTPRTGVSKKLKALDSKKSDLNATQGIKQ
jgi:hypothetical protein